MPVLVRNTQMGPTVFTDEASKVAIEWAGLNDASGNDLQYVPDRLVLENHVFQRVLDRGILKVEDSTPEVMDALRQQSDQWRAKQARIERNAIEAIDMKANNDIVTLACIGPNNRGTGLCGVEVPIREKTKYDHPALCPQHAGLESQFVVTETDKLENGAPGKVWTRIAVTQREKQF